MVAKFIKLFEEEQEDLLFTGVIPYQSFDDRSRLLILESDLTFANVSNANLNKTTINSILPLYFSAEIKAWFNQHGVQPLDFPSSLIKKEMQVVLFKRQIEALISMGIGFILGHVDFCEIYPNRRLDRIMALSKEYGLVFLDIFFIHYSLDRNGLIIAQQLVEFNASRAVSHEDEEEQRNFQAYVYAGRSLTWYAQKNNDDILRAKLELFRNLVGSHSFSISYVDRYGALQNYSEDEGGYIELTDPASNIQSITLRNAQINFEDRYYHDCPGQLVKQSIIRISNVSGGITEIINKIKGFSMATFGGSSVGILRARATLIDRIDRDLISPQASVPAFYLDERSSTPSRDAFTSRLLHDVNYHHQITAWERSQGKKSPKSYDTRKKLLDSMSDQDFEDMKKYLNGSWTVEDLRRKHERLNDQELEDLKEKLNSEFSLRNILSTYYTNVP